MKVGDAIKAWRLSLGMSQSQYAEAIDGHRAQIGAWERGLHSPQVSSLEPMFKLHRVDEVRFFMGPHSPDSPSAPPQTQIIKRYESEADFMAMHRGTDFSCPLAPPQSAVVRITTPYNEPEIRRGDYVVIGYSLRPRDGQIAIAQLDKSKKVVVGEWRRRDDHIVPLNPWLPSFEPHFTIRGVILWVARNVEDGIQR